MMIGLQGRHIDVPFVLDLASCPKILDRIEDVMGPDIMTISTHFFCKYADHTDKFVAWSRT